MGTAMKHPVPDRVKPPFAIFDIRALWHSGPSVRVSGCQKIQMGIKGLINFFLDISVEYPLTLVMFSINFCLPKLLTVTTLGLDTTTSPLLNNLQIWIIAIFHTHII